jgi:HAD superfamily hydrolase (TIGR01549 family)
MQIDAVIFDLDETLLDTSPLREARQGSHWSDVMRRLEEVKPFELEPAEVDVLDVPARLRANGVPVGVLTASPRHYAEALLERFAIPHDALVTGSDGYASKPDPSGLRAIAANLGVPAERCAHVGDTDTDTAAAVKGGALAIGVCWSSRAPETWRRWWPDISISDPVLLLKLAQGERLRLLAEATLAGDEVDWHWGTLAAVEVGVFACGRYFPTADARNAATELSPLILAAKDDPARAADVGAIFAKVAAKDDWSERFSRVCSVPPKPESAFDRFEAVRADLAPRLDAADGGGDLEMTFDVPNYKHLDHDARRAANQDRFRAADVAEEAVLLIDDVVTSGGQAEACRDALLRAGAAEVVILGLGLTQDSMPETCPQCNVGILKIFRRHRDGHPFIGCANWRTTGCSYTREV